MRRAVYAFAKLGQTILWGAPTHDQAGIGFMECARALSELIGLGAVQTVRNREIRNSWSEARILFRSLDDPDNARGHSADGIILDEAQLVNPAAWFEVLQATISDRNGWAWMLGTPKGRNWWWDLKQQNLDDPEWLFVNTPTIGARIVDGRLVRAPNGWENPHYPWKELQRIFRTTPEKTFRQEYLAEFLEDAGSVFRGVVAAAIAREQQLPLIGHRYAFGVDWGRFHDFTAIAVWDVTLKALVALDRFNRIEYSFQRQRLHSLARIFNPDVIFCESNSVGIPIIEELEREGLSVKPFLTTPKSKKEAVESLSLAIERGGATIIADPILVAELQSFEQSQTAGGNIRFGAPAGKHDDCVMAAAIGWVATGIEAAMGFDADDLETVDETEGSVRWAGY